VSIQLSDRLTPVTPEAAIKALADAYLKVTGRKPSRAILNLLAAQSSLETGNWQIMHNFEMGNAKSKSSDPFFQVYGTHDDPTDPGAHYAAHKSLEEGAEHYINVLKGRPHWWAALQSAKPLTFIQGLSTPPVYFTANPVTYLDTLTKQINRYAPTVKKYSPSIWVSLAIAALVATGAYGVAKRAKG
jgi:hypothetical protein